MHLLPPLIDDKRGEPEVTARLAALVKRVVELHDTGLWSCHCAKEFILRRIHPLNHLDKLAYEFPRFDDPSHDPADSKILTSFIAATDLISSSSYVILTDDEVFRLVSRIFDESLVTRRPASMLALYCCENPPPSIRVFIFFDISFICY
jgi:hypothetical protein